MIHSSVFRTYTQLSYVARLTAVTVDGRPIRSRHGLTFVPRAAVGTGYDRLLVPGRDAAHAHRVNPAWKPVYLHTRTEFAFESTLRDLAVTTDLPTARWVARTLEYRPGDLAGAAFPWLPTLLLILATVAGGDLYVLARVALARAALAPRPRSRLRHLAEILGRRSALAHRRRRTGCRADLAAVRRYDAGRSVTASWLASTTTATSGSSARVVCSSPAAQNAASPAAIGSHTPS
jgi:hypothetical protein